MNICELIESQNNSDSSDNDVNNKNDSVVDTNTNDQQVELTNAAESDKTTADAIVDNSSSSSSSSSSSDTDGGGGGGGGGSESQENDNSSDNHLTPLHLISESQSIEFVENFDYLDSLTKFFRLCDSQKLDLAIKFLMPALESCSTHDEYMKIFANLRNACFFNDLIVRSIWIEQIPNVVQYFRNQNLLDENLNTEIAIIISNLMQYTSYQVRKIASATLVTLIERNLIETSKIEQYIIPCLLNLVNENNDDINIECVSLFGKLAPLIGRELTVKHLLVPFCRLCSSPVFHTRKVCATNIGEIATVVSSKDVEEFLLPHFSDFIKDQVWAIRKVCAEIFANIANKCTRKTRESVLTECFIKLLEDNSRWVKISAYKTLGSFIATFLKDENDENKTEASTPPTQRQIELENAKKFYNNRTDKGFIASLLNKKYSKPSGTNNSNGSQQSLSIRLDNEADENEPKKTIPLPPPQPKSSQQQSTTPLTTVNSFDKKHETSQRLIVENNYVELQNNTTSGTSDSNVELKSMMQYSNFLYWRDELPELNFDENDEAKESNTVTTEATTTTTDKKQDELEIEIDDSTSDDFHDLYKAEKQRRKSATMFRDFNGSLLDNKNEATPSLLSSISLSTTTTTTTTTPTPAPVSTPAAVQAPTQTATIFCVPTQTVTITAEEQTITTENDSNNDLHEQDIVPPKLLSYFITMVDMNAQTSLDSEMNYNCAFNFPAIAHTLGPSYWKYIKDLYKKLAEDVNWKVRQTLAYSIHELALILGTEVTQADLVPIFDGYIKDVDEVRIGIVSNLSKFLRILQMEYRQAYMPKLNDFLKMDNQRNWRFRNELGLQISEFCELFPIDCIAKFIQPVAFTLALDKVAEVRLTAIGALTQILKQFYLSNEQQFCKNFVEDIVRTFANSEKWTFRQLYTTLCSNLLESNTDIFAAFSSDFLPHLLALRNDKVPNIRLSLARVLATHLDTLQSISSNLMDDVQLTIESLSKDSDSDVHSYFNKTTKTSEENLLNKTIDLTNTTIRPTKTSNNNENVGINVNLLNDSLNGLNLNDSVNENNET